MYDNLYTKNSIILVIAARNSATQKTFFCTFESQRDHFDLQKLYLFNLLENRIPKSQVQVQVQFNLAAKHNTWFSRMNLIYHFIWFAKYILFFGDCQVFFRNSSYKVNQRKLRLYSYWISSSFLVYNTYLGFQSGTHLAFFSIGSWNQSIWFEIFWVQASTIDI